MKKTELIGAIAQGADVPKSQAQKHFDAFERVVTEALKGGDEVQITGTAGKRRYVSIFTFGFSVC